MQILAIDTTTKKANVGLKVATDKINNNYINSIENEITHSEKLLPLIDETLKQANTDISKIDMLACTIGPGSFTGIRIGIATIKAIAKVTNSKIFAINTLELLAYSTENISKYNCIVSLIDAKNKRAYIEVFLVNNGLLESVHYVSNEYVDDAIKNILNLINEKNISLEDVLFITDSENLISLLPENINKVQSELSISALLNMASVANKFENYLTLDATYLRDSQAERVKNGENC